MSTSNWEDARARSNYHFNKWHKDTDCVEHLGKFTGGWQTELQTVIDDAKPLNWGNRRKGTGRSICGSKNRHNFVCTGNGGPSPGCTRRTAGSGGHGRACTCHKCGNTAGSRPFSVRSDGPFGRVGSCSPPFLSLDPKGTLKGRGRGRRSGRA